LSHNLQQADTSSPRERPYHSHVEGGSGHLQQVVLGCSCRRAAGARELTYVSRVNRQDVRRMLLIEKFLLNKTKLL
jgi:hypothetical protein